MTGKGGRDGLGIICNAALVKTLPPTDTNQSYIYSLFIPYTACQARGTPWTSHQSVTGLTCIDKKPQGFFQGRHFGLSE